MTNLDLSDFRRHFQLSAPALAKLLLDPVTKQTVSARTLYRWEAELPEVSDLPAWVSSALETLGARFAKAGRAKFLHRGFKRPHHDAATGQITTKVWNGHEFVDEFGA